MANPDALTCISSSRSHSTFGPFANNSGLLGFGQVFKSVKDPLSSRIKMNTVFASAILLYTDLNVARS